MAITRPESCTTISMSSASDRSGEDPIDEAATTIVAGKTIASNVAATVINGRLR
jgi:hypothetical protein